MKNQIIGFVTACVAFLLTSSAFGDLISQTQVTFTGNGPEYTYDSGAVNGPTSHNASPPGPGTLTGSASASFGAGALHASADAEAFVQPGDGRSLTAQAVSTYYDNLTFITGSYGSPITITASWNLKGATTSSVGADGTGTVSNAYGLPAYVESVANSQLYIAGAGFSGPPVLWAQDYRYVYNLPGDSSTTKFDPSPVVPLIFTAFSGIPFTLYMQLDAEASASVLSFDATTGNGGNAGATSDFSQTLLWGGISGVTDSQGNPITDWTVTSDSGFDYSQPATEPEPSTLLLLGISMAGLLQRRTKKVT